MDGAFSYTLPVYLDTTEISEKHNLSQFVDSTICELLSIIYIPWPFPPVWGVADNTKETNKNNGGFTPFFQQ